MEDKWCPENDGAYRMELAALHRDDPMQLLRRARAEITQLRAELVDERELAFRRGIKAAVERLMIEQGTTISRRVISAIESLNYEGDK